MNCPNCNTVNDSGSRFCISCGEPLLISADSPAASQPFARSPRHLLGIVTARVLIGLLLVWILRAILINLAFVETLRFPEVPLTAPQLVTMLTYLVAIVLLLGYARSLRSLWAQAFPKAAAFAPALTAIIYVLVLSAVYATLLPLFSAFIDDSADFILTLRIILLILAIILLGWAAKVIYDALPGWLSTVHFDLPVSSAPEIACLNCGQLNATAVHYCSRCGHALSHQHSEPDS